ncbi:MAG: hypothetical protein KJ592_00520 [Nanoarchaeota archaeon]|nr:hypothetical protein [Nanoarchaeota archaeon]
MTQEEIAKKLRDCIRNAKRDEAKGIKHNGLIIGTPNNEEAKNYIKKAKRELELCEFYKEKEFDYKIPEEWFYTLYYCALAILSKFGVESRSQRYTALFLRYIKEKNLIDYENNYIDRITVYSKKGDESEVDKREEARYSSSIEIESVKKRYEEITILCKNAIFQAEEIIFSNEDFKIPEELLSENFYNNL